MHRPLPMMGHWALTQTLLDIVMKRFDVNGYIKWYLLSLKKLINGMSPARHLGSAAFNSFFSFEFRYSTNLS